MERKWWTLLAVCTGVFMLLLDITIVNVALPYIQQALKVFVAVAARLSFSVTVTTIEILPLFRFFSVMSFLLSFDPV